MNTAPIVSRVWSFCTTLRDDGVSYGYYLEQLTYLIFLKMADEYGKPPYDRDVGIPEIDGGGPISPNDSPVADGERYDYVLANPPFGKKSAPSFTNERRRRAADRRPARARGPGRTDHRESGSGHRQLP